MTTFTTEDRIIAEKNGSVTINVEPIPFAGMVTLTETVPKPAAWFYQYPGETGIFMCADAEAMKGIEGKGYIITPLYTHPAKYCPSENNAAYEKSVIDGMSKMTESVVHRAVEEMAIKELTDDAIRYQWIRKEFANGRETYLAEGIPSEDKLDRYIDEQLRKAQEK